jgi:RimJ/RimL family protein N-acetyltransferase
MNIPRSERLHFRLMTQDDCQLLFELDQDPAVMKYINGGVASSMADIEEALLPRLASFTNEEKGWGLWHTSLSSNNEFIGWILVRPMDFFGNKKNELDLEIGWRFKQSSWGKGYATEAAQQVTDTICQMCPALECFSATALVDNLGSIKVMKNIGMEYIKNYIYKDLRGEHDAVLYRKNVISC